MVLVLDLDENTHTVVAVADGCAVIFMAVMCYHSALKPQANASFHINAILKRIHSILLS